MKTSSYQVMVINDVFEKVTALSKLSVTRWTVPANAFNKVNSLYSYLRTYFCIFSVIYFSIYFLLLFISGLVTILFCV